MNRTVFAWTMSIAIAMTAPPASAQHGRGGGKPSGTPHTAPAPKPPTPHGSHGALTQRRSYTRAEEAPPRP